ncbi:MAG: hypothetical protein P4L85_16955 [Paludisphaera borealis]|uniref:hypothetical protein n=1 Tax=Paludisphaera borealis TaxID=1387353 RepID=UPI00283B32ED|nr:hypothetical protein [Paludisphaera borealis]MDR3621043.1 hypothetical protein [Paludisphaera borealis]
MKQRTLEGIWEEIVLQGGELVGRRVRVTVLDEPVSRVTLDKALAHLISSAESLSGTLPKIDSSNATDTWSDSVDEKYRHQGFKF